MRLLVTSAAVALLTVGCTEWAPNSTEAQLTSLYHEKSPQFRRITEMISAEPRLAKVSRDPQSWDAVRSSGVGDTQIAEYVQLLQDIEANEKLSEVHGLGKVTLIVSDPWMPLPGANMAGFVLSPIEPHPIVSHLDQWSPSSGEDVAFRPLSEGWFMFRLVD